MLSEIIARGYCPAVNPLGPDRFFSVGCHSVGSSWGPTDPVDAARVASQADIIAKSKHRPWDVDGGVDDVFNDLFSPFRELDAGRMLVWIPVPIEEALASSLMAQDWRIVGLVWWAVSRQGFSGHVIATAFDAAGRTMSCDFRSEDILAAFEVLHGVRLSNIRVPGAACQGCSQAPTCTNLQMFIDDYGAPAKPNIDSSLRGFRLFNQRAEIMLKLEALERRRDAIDAELGKLVKDGKLRIGPDDELLVPSRTTGVWDFGMVRRVLMAHGLWDDSFGSVRSSDLQKAMIKFPKEVVKELAKARSERVSQPSIAEAARHGRFATGPAFLGGVALQGKGGLGKGQ